MKKSLSIHDRVDILLKEGIDNPKKWIGISGYVEPSQYDMYDLNGNFYYHYYDLLKKHHLEETNHLFEIINELVSRLKESK